MTETPITLIERTQLWREWNARWPIGTPVRYPAQHLGTDPGFVHEPARLTDQGQILVNVGDDGWFPLGSVQPLTAAAARASIGPTCARILEVLAEHDGLEPDPETRQATRGRYELWLPVGTGRLFLHSHVNGTSLRKLWAYGLVAYPEGDRAARTVITATGKAVAAAKRTRT